MRMKLARKGLLAHKLCAENDTLSDRPTIKWNKDDLKVLGVIVVDVRLLTKSTSDTLLVMRRLGPLSRKNATENTLRTRF